MNKDEIVRLYDRRGTVGPIFDSVKIEEVRDPWNEDYGSTIQATYEDPVLRGYKALIVSDSIDHDPGDSEDLITPSRVTTMVVKYPRIILPEFNTHRAFSRNSASSRARSIKATIKPVVEDPFIPLWTRNHKGMGGSYSSTNEAMTATRQWLKSRDDAVANLLRLLMNQKIVTDYFRIEDWSSYVNRYQTAYKNDEIPVDWSDIHKQDANRLIEPWMWHETVVTSTYWKNFYDLRISDHAQPEVKAIAILMRAVMDASLDRHVLKHEVIHAPFVSITESDLSSWESLKGKLLESASECARISYVNRDSARNKEIGLGERLLRDGHMSPFEHIAWSSSEGRSIPAIADAMNTISDRDLTSNLSGNWVQFRRVISPREQ